VEVQGKPVEVANVERAKVMVECVVKEAVVDGKVKGLLLLRRRPLGRRARAGAYGGV